MTSPLQQKIKITGPSMVTANRTSDGIVIYIAPVELKDSGEIKPGNLRERIRSKGLTIDLLPA